MEWSDLKVERTLEGLGGDYVLSINGPKTILPPIEESVGEHRNLENHTFKKLGNGRRRLRLVA